MPVTIDCEFSPFALTAQDAEFPRYTDVTIRYTVEPVRGGYLAFANEEGQRRALKRYPGAVCQVVVLPGNKNYEPERFKDDLDGHAFERRAITPRLSQVLAARIGDSPKQTVRLETFIENKLILRGLP